MESEMKYVWATDQSKQNWLKFENINCSNHKFFASIESHNNAQNHSKGKEIYQTNKKLENPSKGSLCYTKEGYGIIQNLKSEGVYEIKLKDTDRIVIYQKHEVKFEMPLKISVLLNNVIIDSSIVVSLNTKISQLSQKINEALSGQFKGGECQAIIYNGKELNKYQDQELFLLGINQNSRFLAVNPKSFIQIIFQIFFQAKLYTLSRYQKIKEDSWYYSNKSADGICFTVSKQITIAGMGIFTTSTQIEFEVKLVEGDSANGPLLASKLILASRDQGNIQECLFEKPVKLNPEQTYSLVQIALKSGNGFYGEDAPITQETENGIIINFKSCNDADNGTGQQKTKIYNCMFRSHKRTNCRNLFLSLKN